MGTAVDIGRRMKQVRFISGLPIILEEPITE